MNDELRTLAEEMWRKGFIAMTTPTRVIFDLLYQIDALQKRFDEAGRYAVIQARQIDALKAERDTLKAKAAEHRDMRLQHAEELATLRLAAQAGLEAIVDHGRACLGHLKQYTDATNDLIAALGVK